ncbi:hypothetical protein [Halomonas heilongjiangensis]|uniref:Cyd operon protein YbgE n=1 Tax=Halomonas heilongjiangensis TaxID=1387883 RepID=A0A2N7TT45_9GAMM|nr:hypothetical protein [Halomonas heilongjiangensis]PMR71372.1 hypothetical protein C1H66_02825 [Halomonas heilongjiangensis]PXX88643.1 hypothetical protein CR158_13890 [Halomonas heilongjiangensis]
MRIETRRHLPWALLGSILLAAGLAVWLLLQPGLLRDLPLPLRLPLMGLGIWALGAAFMQALGLEARWPWLRRMTTPPWSLVALAAFTLVLLGRGLTS